jgi:DNA polymerase bacteriophage-type
VNLTEALETLSMIYGSPLSVMSDCLRGFLVPAEGHDFIAADFSAIEARVLAWLAGEEHVLETFRGHGKIYEHAASTIYKKPIEEITKVERQLGKIAVLALGYQGGVGAFQSMARTTGVKVSDEQADEIKVAWREAHPNIVRYWYDIDRAAIAAVEKPGKIFVVETRYSLTKYVVRGSFLWCQLPSNRVLCYPYPKIEETLTPWGATKPQVTYMGENSLSHKWERMKAYGGMLVENITQAVARDILVEAMLRLEKKNYPIILHVHDEVVCEVPKAFGSVADVETILCEVPTWGEGLPIKAEGWRGNRYQK